MQIFKIKGKEILLDDEDYEWITDLKYWHFVGKKNYANYLTLPHNKKHQGMIIYLHRLILLAQEGYDKLWDRGFQIDHIDRNPLNNQKSKLRIVTRSENCLNRDNKNYFGSMKFSLKNKNFRGVKVFTDKRNKKFYTQIVAYCKGKYLGTFKTKEEAAKAWDIEALKIYGEKVKPYLNFLI